MPAKSSALFGLPGLNPSPAPKAASKALKTKGFTAFSVSMTITPESFSNTPLVWVILFCSGDGQQIEWILVCRPGDEISDFAIGLFCSAYMRTDPVKAWVANILTPGSGRSQAQLCSTKEHRTVAGIGPHPRCAGGMAKPRPTPPGVKRPGRSDSDDSLAWAYTHTHALLASV